MKHALFRDGENYSKSSSNKYYLPVVDGLFAQKYGILLSLKALYRSAK